MDNLGTLLVPSWAHLGLILEPYLVILGPSWAMSELRVYTHIHQQFFLSVCEHDNWERRKGSYCHPRNRSLVAFCNVLVAFCMSVEETPSAQIVYGTAISWRLGLSGRAGTCCARGVRIGRALHMYVKLYTVSPLNLAKEGLGIVSPKHLRSRPWHHSLLLSVEVY